MHLAVASQATKLEADEYDKENHAPRNGTPTEAELQSQWHATSAELAAAKLQRKGLQHDLDALQKSVGQRQAELHRLSVETAGIVGTTTVACQTAATETAAAGVQCVEEALVVGAPSVGEAEEVLQTQLELAATNEALQVARAEAERVRAELQQLQAEVVELQRQRGEAWLDGHREERTAAEALQTVRDRLRRRPCIRGWTLTAGSESLALLANCLVLSMEELTVVDVWRRTAEADSGAGRDAGAQAAGGGAGGPAAAVRSPAGGRTHAGGRAGERGGGSCAAIAAAHAAAHGGGASQAARRRWSHAAGVPPPPWPKETPPPLPRLNGG